MKEWLLRIYDFFTTHHRWLGISVTIVLVVLVGLSVSLRYDEDIMDFLPVTEEERASLEAFQNQQSAAQIVLIVEGDDEDMRTDALYEIEEQLSAFDFRLSTFDSQLSSLYAMMPTLIPDSTYNRLDSLFTREAIRTALERDKMILSTPGSGVIATAIQHDPLALIPLSTFDFQLSTNNRSYAFLDSPYGATETKHNAALIDSLNAQISIVQSQFPYLDIRLIGAPVIAVGNAHRIKTDTLLCIAFSLVFIIALLAYAFPRRRDIFLILLAVSFGWLTGMAILRLITPIVSAVVIGIGSVLIGIAVNYPLHLLVHQRYTTSVRQTLNEVLSPLVVGNITTVGAFLALVPLQAAALRHLGIFAASMLIGTILFCIFVLPHLMSTEYFFSASIGNGVYPVATMLPRRGRGVWRPMGRAVAKWVYAVRSMALKKYPTIILALTLIVGIYLLLPFNSNHSPLFDSNLSHINYMTDQQREDMASFNVPQGDASRWNDYWSTHSADSVIERIQTEAEAVGFTPEAFTPFYNQITNYKLPISNFRFDNLAQRLSDDFDYIGLCCSLIVFIFLILSFRSFWLALIAFVPMALSWIWIFAIMQLLGIQFNIVNIILATFIFGQGDDYTIFIVEGLVYEHRTGKSILPQYRQSIILSAAIMLIGIGILVFAQHPAMHSLGAVTLIGMTITLIMATTIPPILYRWYIALSERKITKK